MTGHTDSKGKFHPHTHHDSHIVYARDETKKQLDKFSRDELNLIRTFHGKNQGIGVSGGNNTRQIIEPYDRLIKSGWAKIEVNSNGISIRPTKKGRKIGKEYDTNVRELLRNDPNDHRYFHTS